MNATNTRNTPVEVAQAQLAQAEAAVQPGDRMALKILAMMLISEVAHIGSTDPNAIPEIVEGILTGAFQTGYACALDDWRETAPAGRKTAIFSHIIPEFFEGSGIEASLFALSDGGYGLLTRVAETRTAALNRVPNPDDLSASDSNCLAFENFDMPTSEIFARAGYSIA